MLLLLNFFSKYHCTTLSSIAYMSGDTCNGHKKCYDWVVPSSRPHYSHTRTILAARARSDSSHPG